MQRYILTDAGNVMATFKFRTRVVEEIMAGFGVTNANSLEVFCVKGDIATSNEQYYHALDTGEFSAYDIWLRLIHQCQLPPDICTYPLFLSLWCKHLEPIKGVVDFYRQLQERFRLVVVSNGDSENVRHLLYHLIGAHGLRFEEIFISAERRKKKPELLDDVLMFLSSRNIAPSNCVFVDDLLPYVQAANARGIPSIQFDGSKEPVEKLKEPLAKLGFC